ncbi:MAG: hypothetical protein Q8R60_09240 [Mycobacteriales bacterium]|nr:hypothetical protein [Mycobacteriales bacterium]
MDDVEPWVILLSVLTVVAVFAALAALQLRAVRRMDAPGEEGRQARLRYARRSYAAVVVPLVEDLQDRVAALEQEVDRLTRSKHWPVA